MTRRAALVLILGLVAVLAIAWMAPTRTRAPTQTPTPEAPPSTQSSVPAELRADTVDAIAEGFVQLVLAVGRYDADYVDAYFGPPALRDAGRGIPRERIVPEGRRLRRALDTLPQGAGDPVASMRRASLGAHLDALVAVMGRLDGRTLPFDDDARVVYDVEVPPFDEAANAAVLEELDRLLPGEGPLATRYGTWHLDYVLPAELWDQVLRAALAEGRRRTLAFIDLPPEETVEVEYVTGKPWSAFNEYHGGYRSIVQVNRSAKMPLGSALRYACHEAYPGHHVLNVLQEKRLVNDRGWIEFSVHPLYGPGAVIAEGTACQAMSVAFPGAERDAFLAEILFPLAGLDPQDAATYGRITDLVEQLDRAQTEAARRMLAPEGRRRRVSRWLAKHTHLTASSAYAGLDFAEHYGSYVATYSVGSDWVRTWLDANTREGGPGSSEQELFADLLQKPYLPRDLRLPELR